MPVRKKSGKAIAFHVFRKACNAYSTGNECNRSLNAAAFEPMEGLISRESADEMINNNITFFDRLKRYSSDAKAALSNTCVDKIKRREHETITIYSTRAGQSKSYFVD